jgi:hypothetical protein
MQQLLKSRSAIYDRFHSSSASTALAGDDFAAYYTSMFLIQDTGEAVCAHLQVGFSDDPMRAYIEFWGVMQAIFIQQDAVGELHLVVVGKKLGPPRDSAWMKLRDIRNACAGHPASRKVGVPATQRTFMSRSFGNYGRIIYERWDARDGVTHPTFNLRQMIVEYEGEAVQALASVLAAMTAKWP